MKGVINILAAMVKGLKLLTGHLFQLSNWIIQVWGGALEESSSHVLSQLLDLSSNRKGGSPLPFLSKNHPKPQMIHTTFIITLHQFPLPNPKKPTMLPQTNQILNQYNIQQEPHGGMSLLIWGIFFFENLTCNGF